MKSLEISGNMDSRKKLLMGLFWTNRKSVRTEGCAPFLIEKIVMDNNTYTANEGKFLKLSEDILNEILDSIKNNKPVEFEIKLGEENIKASFKDNLFSVETVKNKELEDDIIE